MGQLLWHSHICTFGLGTDLLRSPPVGRWEPAMVWELSVCPCNHWLKWGLGLHSCVGRRAGDLGSDPWDLSISLHPLTGAAQWPELHVPLYLMRHGT